MKPFLIGVCSVVGNYCIALWKDGRVLGATIGILLQIAAVVVYYYFHGVPFRFIMRAFVLWWALSLIYLIAWWLRRGNSSTGTEKKTNSGRTGIKKIL
jgi:predicted MFS family arabinose efflux permease